MGSRILRTLRNKSSQDPGGPSSPIRRIGSISDMAVRTGDAGTIDDWTNDDGAKSDAGDWNQDPGSAGSSTLTLPEYRSTLIGWLILSV